MRAERLLRILLLLQSRERLTVRELATRLDVSARTVQRDLEAMSLAGVPIYATRGRAGGWSLLPDFRSRLFGLTAAEAMTVFAGATAHVLADLGLEPGADQAYAKLLTALPAGIRRDAQFTLQRILVDRPGWDDDDGEDSTWLTHCRQGLWEERQVIIRYGKRQKSITVGPLGLVAKGRAWYLVALTGGEIRTYRVSRIVEAELTEQPFERPEDFELSDYWKESALRLRSGWPSYPVVVAMRDRCVGAFARRRGVRITPGAEHGLDAGWSLIEIDLENPGEARSVVLALAGDAVVHEPAELRVEVRKAAEQLARLHDQDSTP